MGRLLTAACLLAALAGAPAARADGLDLSVDLRAVSSDATPSRLGGGLGKLRYDSTQEGLRLGYLRLGYRADLSETMRVTAEAFAYGDHDVNALDLTELYLDWRPIPSSAWRSRVKLGAFYPEISMENRMRGWRSPYTLSFSAIDTWVGEELRTIGAEYALDWLGRSMGHSFEFSLNAALFGWNDPAGTVLGSRGWAIHDRQSTLFGRFANRGAPLPERTVFYDEMDKRAGYYAGMSATWRGLVDFRYLHYDNRANLAAESDRIQDGAWETYFDSFGLRSAPDPHWTFIAQWLHGRTWDDAELPSNAWSYDSEYLLASYRTGAMRYSARYDRFWMLQTSSTFIQYTGFYLADRGHAWTLAVTRDLGEHWSAVLEGVRVDSWTAARTFTGEARQQRENQLQLAIRYER